MKLDLATRKSLLITENPFCTNQKLTLHPIRKDIRGPYKQDTLQFCYENISSDMAIK